MDTPDEEFVKELEVFNKRFNKTKDYLGRLYDEKERIEYKISNVESFQQFQSDKAESVGLKWDYNIGKWVKLDG